MLSTIQERLCQDTIKGVARSVCSCLAGVIAPRVGKNMEGFAAGLILATNKGQPLASWLLSPECLFDGASDAFRTTYAKAAAILLVPGKKPSPGEVSRSGLPLKEMIHDRFDGLSNKDAQEFLCRALTRHTDIAALFNVLVRARRSNPTLYQNLSSFYILKGDEYESKVASPCRTAVEVRNTYIGHDNLSLFESMTAELLQEKLNALIEPVKAFVAEGDPALTSLYARRDKAVFALRCAPLSEQKLAEAIPGFDRFVLLHSQLGADFDPVENVLYLHPLEEVTAALAEIRLHYENTSSRMRRQEEHIDAILEMQAQMQSSLTALSALVQAKSARSAPAAVSGAPAPAVPAAPAPAPLPALPRMQEYRQGRLTEPQLAEVVTRCHVLADASCWISREGQRFLTERVLPLQNGSKKRVIVDWATRVDLYHTELDSQSSPVDRTRAHDARIVMSHLHHQGKINYAPERAGLQSSPASLIDVAQRNPGQTICFLTMDPDFCRVLARLDLPNVIPLMVVSGMGCLVHPKLRALVQRNSLGTPGSAAEPAPQAPEAPAEPEVIVETGSCLPWTEPAEGMVLHTGGNTEVRLGTKLAEGGEGEIYTTGDPALVAKLYNKRHLTANRRDKLTLMLEKDPHIRGLCWPTALLFHADGSFAGFLMPRIDPAYRELTTSVLQLGKPSVQKQLAGWDRLALVRICRALCRLLDQLHRADILLGDINPRNILVRTADPEHPDLAVVDCDSCQVGRYPCPVGTVLHTSPAIYKRLDTTNPRYGTFLRTPEDEDYAMTVLLFELLMLNQSPFSSKGVTDLGQAVREGKFAYRFTAKNTNETLSDGSETPDGPYRMIWGNMPYAIREGFFDTFARCKPLSPARWETALQNYEHDILQGTYTRDLTPSRYFDWDGTHTVDFTCEECGAKANMPRDRWETNRKYHRLNLCNTCYSAMLRLLNDPALVPVHCVNCGKEFQGNKWQATLEDRRMPERGRPRDRLCPDCRQTVQLTCAVCGKPFSMRKGKWETLSRRGIKPRCRDCFTPRT